MLKVSNQTFEAFQHASAEPFVDRAIEWLRSLPELQGSVAVATRVWMHARIDEARGFGIESEDAVSRFARLVILRGPEWIAKRSQQEILGSSRDGSLKVFQLECLDEGVTDANPSAGEAGHA